MSDLYRGCAPCPQYRTRKDHGCNRPRDRASSGGMLPRAVFVLALLAFRAPAHADESAIRWEAPAGCPAAEVFRARVVENLGREPREGEVDARAVVAKKGARWRVDMTVKTAAGEGVRELEAASCQELAESAALILALTIDPTAGSGEVEVVELEREAAADETTTTEELRTEVATLGDDEDPPPADLRRDQKDVAIRTPYTPVDVDTRFRLLVGGDLGSMPGAAPGVGAAIEIALGNWSGDIGVQTFAAQDALMPEEPMPKGAHVSVTSVVARACYAGGPRWWRAGGCLGGDLMLVRSAQFGLSDPEPESTDPAGGPQLGVVFALRLIGPFALRADVATTFQAVRIIQTSGEDPVEVVLHDPNLLVWRGFVGVEATWE